MFCSFIMVFQSLNPLVTEIYGVALTKITPAQQLITTARSNPLSKTRVNENDFPTFIICLNMLMRAYNFNKSKIMRSFTLIYFI